MRQDRQLMALGIRMAAILRSRDAELRRLLPYSPRGRLPGPLRLRHHRANVRHRIAEAVHALGKGTKALSYSA